MRRGEVWTLTDSTARVRVVVMSGDEYNAAGAAYCAPVVRRSGASAPPYAVALTDPDPVAGIVLVGQTAALSTQIPGELVGMVTGASMARLCDALRDLFEL